MRYYDLDTLKPRIILMDSLLTSIEQQKPLKGAAKYYLKYLTYPLIQH